MFRAQKRLAHAESRAWARIVRRVNSGMRKNMERQIV
jgi:hypothetical protein